MVMMMIITIYFLMANCRHVSFAVSHFGIGGLFLGTFKQETFWAVVEPNILGLFLRIFESICPKLFWGSKPIIFPQEWDIMGPCCRDFGSTFLRNIDRPTGPGFPSFWTHMCVCIDILVPVYTYMYIYMNIPTHIHIYIYIHIRIYIYTYTYVYIYIYIHTYIYKYAGKYEYKHEYRYRYKHRYMLM